MAAPWQQNVLSDPLGRLIQMADDQPPKKPEGDVVPAPRPVLEPQHRNVTRAPMRPGLRSPRARHRNYFTKIRLR